VDEGRYVSDGRFMPRLCREKGSSWARNRLYPGVDTSMSTTVLSVLDVEMVATFH
jgi:hypothetical protein